MEDYEKKYKDAMGMAEEIIKYYKEHNRGDENSIEDLEGIFPELKESEDEKIRKALIKGVESCKASGWTNFGNNVDIDVVLAWLKEQGKQKPISDTRYKVNADGSLSVVNGNPFDYEHATITQKDFACDAEEASYTAEVATGDGSIKTVVSKKVSLPYPQSKEWSEEDERVKKRILLSLEKDLMATKNSGCDTQDLEQCIAWLEKQCQTFTKKDIDDAYLKGICDAKNELEKQGEQKPAVVDFNAKDWYVSKVDGKIHDLTYNPTDKVGPKFKVGDTIISSRNNVIKYLIKEVGIENELGELDYVVEDVSDSEFRGSIRRLSIKKVDEWAVLCEEQKLAWSEEDERMLHTIIADFKGFIRYNTSTLESHFKECVDWLKSLKDRVQPQNLTVTDEELAQAKKNAYNDALDKIEYHSGEPTFDDGWSAAISYIQKKSVMTRKLQKPKPAWSEEDKDMLYKATAVINRLCAEGKEYIWPVNTLRELFCWLKSFKTRLEEN